MKIKIATQNKPLWLAGFGVAALFIIIFAIAWLIIQAKSHKNFGQLPDFASISDINEMKIAFLNYLTPIIQYHNSRIQQERNQLIFIQTEYKNNHQLKRKHKKTITQMAKQYGYSLNTNWGGVVKKIQPRNHKNTQLNISDNEKTISQTINELLLRVDEIPLNLALVQAAKESGWGRSRFAVEANNLFGQWCYTKGCGLVPTKRAKSANHEVAIFKSPYAAIASYMNNLNSHRRYALLRNIRADLRSQGKPVTGKALANGLIYYSQRREAYVADIKSMLGDYKKLSSKLAMPITQKQPSNQ